MNFKKEIFHILFTVSGTFKHSVVSANENTTDVVSIDDENDDVIATQTNDKELLRGIIIQI